MTSGASPRRRRPRVTWVFGATLDGRVAAPDGSSRWISSRPARVDAHRLRAAHDAVLVGSGAARTDDPHLAVRHGVRGPVPVRIVLDAKGAIVTSSSRVVDTAAPTLVVIGPDARAPDLPAHVEIARVAIDERGRIDLTALLRALAKRGITSLLVEGGPTIASAFLTAGLVDNVVAYIRAAILGAGRSLVDVPHVTSIGELHKLKLETIERVGQDVRITASTRARRVSNIR